MARSCSGWTTANYFSRSDTGITAEPLTMGVWIKVASVTAGAARCWGGLGNNGAAGEYIGFLTAAGAFSSQKANDAGTTMGAASGATLIDANTWTFVAAIFVDDSTPRTYAKNVIFEKTFGTSVSDPTIDFQAIGARVRAAITIPFDGNVALLTMWNAELFLAEFDALSGGDHPVRIRPKNIMRAWWNPTSGSRLTDFSGNAANLTLTGTVTDDAFGPPVEPFPYHYSMPIGVQAPLVEEAAVGRPFRLAGIGGGLVGEPGRLAA